MMYEYEYLETVRQSALDQNDRFRIVRYEWIKLGIKSKQALIDTYGPRYQHCNRVMLMDQITAYENDEPQHSIVVMYCNEDGSGPSDIPDVEFYVDATRTPDEIFDDIRDTILSDGLIA